MKLARVAARPTVTDEQTPCCCRGATATFTSTPSKATRRRRTGFSTTNEFTDFIARQRFVGRQAFGRAGSRLVDDGPAIVVFRLDASRYRLIRNRISGGTARSGDEEEARH